MKRKFLSLFTIIGIAILMSTPADAWYRGYYGGCCYGGYGYGYGGAMAGAAIAGAIIGGAIASQPYYGGYYTAPPVYYYPYGGYYGPAYGYGYYGW